MNGSITASRTSNSPRSDVVSVAALSRADEEQMFALLSDHFEGANPIRFRRDLAEKEFVVVLRDDARRIRGFSTIMRVRTDVGGETIAAFFSGDTIVASDCRNESALPRAWSRHVFALRAAMPERRVYWFLIASGYKTYRFQSVFFRRFCPTYRSESPAFERRVLAQLASDKFGERYDAARGVIRFLNPMPLRTGVADLTPARLADPDVAFFVQANPGHAAGDELACLCEIAADNLTPAGRRMIGQ